MPNIRLFALSFTSFILAMSVAIAADPSGELIFKDDFNRTESDPAKEQVGNGWGTNSKTRAKGVKQVDLADGALHIFRADVADHGVSVVQDLAFKNAMIHVRFKLGKKDSLGINIADMKEKSVHAGHICLALVKLDKVEISDLKTGRMDKARRTRRLAKKQTDDDKRVLKSKSKYFKNQIKPDVWHDLEVHIKDDTMRVSIDGKKVGEFTSNGIGHDTKSRIRLAVAKSAWVDDFRVWRQ